LIALGRPAVDSPVELLGHRVPHVRWEAAKALGGIGDPKAAPALVEALEEDDDFDVRHRLSQRQAYRLVKPVLAALRALEPELVIPAAVQTALDELKAPSRTKLRR